MPVIPINEFESYIGKKVGVSEWMKIDQKRINSFADATLDHQFIHTKPLKAMLVFGSTIAHGFLTLSLLPYLMQNVSLIPENLKMALNYGLDKVRFLQPVKVNSKIRVQVSLASLIEKKDKHWLAKSEVTMEIEGKDKPAFVAEPLTMFVLK